MDELKRRVADEVARSMDRLFNGRDLDVPFVATATTTHPSDLVTSIRVKTQNQGTRYFEVRVKECW